LGIDVIDGDKCALTEVLNEILGIVSQLRIFTNETNSIFAQEEYEEDIALEKEQLLFV
jgi:lipase chaperone LimK